MALLMLQLPLIWVHQANRYKSGRTVDALEGTKWNTNVIADAYYNLEIDSGTNQGTIT